ncbi:MAG: rhodanese-like domain-containing protein, partial [Anaerolineales bacterium]|nr:rhodanese-like domain-containing protein [Anaerolineales bacterium]
VLVDVRSPEEFARGHIEGSRLLPLSVLPVRYHELPKDATLVVICRSGARSRLACETLAGYGFENLINLDNGVLGWSARGYKMVQ